jgi:hypothetical protein
LNLLLTTMFTNKGSSHVKSHGETPTFAQIHTPAVTQTAGLHLDLSSFTTLPVY